MVWQCTVRQHRIYKTYLHVYICRYYPYFTSEDGISQVCKLRSLSQHGNLSPQLCVLTHSGETVKCGSSVCVCMCVWSDFQMGHAGIDFYFPPSAAAEEKQYVSTVSLRITYLNRKRRSPRMMKAKRLIWCKKHCSHGVIYTLNNVVMDCVRPTDGFSITCINTKVLAQIKQ